MDPDASLLPVPVTLPTAEIAALALRHRKAGGLVMSIVNAAGTRIESRLELLPDGVKDRIETVAAKALNRSYRLAGHTVVAGPKLGERGHLALATLSGALGGFGGFASAVAELPVTVTVIFRSLQRIAAEYGYDPQDEAVRLECLQVFGSGSPLERDDGVNTSFLGARVTITGATLNRVIATVAPRFATVLGEKLAAQAVPLLGSFAGAGINYAFVSYYQEMAHVRFGLKRLADVHGDEAVLAAFREAAG
ncbi:MAG: staphylolytic protease PREPROENZYME LASA [Rhodobacteraceae bacterium]|nr:staphylolytic protease PREPROENZYME LASA [Paracoccaceae bacterium]